MKIKSLLTLGCVSVVASSCGIAPSQLGNSFISTIKEPILVTTNTNYSKEGKACGQNILGIFATGDMSIETAKKNGGITNISAVEKTVNNKVVISDVCTIVKGN
jgi:hypothetical protein